MLSLRPAEASEAQAIADLVSRAIPSRRPDANAETPFFESSYARKADLQNEISEYPHSIFLVMGTDALLGCVLLSPLKSGKWHLGSLIIDPSMQIAGFDLELLEAAEEAAKEKGATVIQVTAKADRESLITWYEQRGYRATGEVLPFPFENCFCVPSRSYVSPVILEKSL